MKLELDNRISENILKQDSFVHRLLCQCVHFNFSYALWRQPNTDAAQLIVDFSEKPSFFKGELQETKGFLIAPYSSSRNALLLKPDLAIDCFEKQASLSPTVSISPKAETFLNNVFSNDPMEPPGKPYFFGGSQNKTLNTSREEYKNLVSQSINSIENGIFDKVVPSRIKKARLPKEFSLYSTFRKTCKAYPHAFVSLVSSPQTGTWLGASPEILIRQKKNGLFQTVALAGTQAINSRTPLADISWRQKEIEEQAMVRRYIVNCFKKIRLREFEEHGPKTVKAGNLAHLKTVFEVDTEELSFPELPQMMLDLLHPTSAVCGMPKKSAHQFLKKKESHDRSYFSGYLGPVNLQDETSLYVNLRCMQILKDEALLYAGAGVTADSDPEKEWLETEAKCHTMLNQL